MKLAEETNLLSPPHHPLASHCFFFLLLFLILFQSYSYFCAKPPSFSFSRKKTILSIKPGLQPAKLFSLLSNSLWTYFPRFPSARFSYNLLEVVDHSCEWISQVAWELHKNPATQQLCNGLNSHFSNWLLRTTVVRPPGQGPFLCLVALGASSVSIQSCGMFLSTHCFESDYEIWEPDQWYLFMILINAYEFICLELNIQGNICA